MSFRIRLLISLLVVAILPLSIAMLLVGRRSFQTSAEQYKRSAVRLTESSTANLDLVMNTAYATLMDLLSTPDISSLLYSIENGGAQEDISLLADKVNDKLISHQSMNNGVFETISLYSEKTASSVVYSYKKSPLEQKIYPTVRAQEGKPLWLLEGEAPEIWLAGAVLRQSNGQTLGMVYIKLRPEFLKPFYQGPAGASGYSAVLADGRIIASTIDPALWGEAAPALSALVTGEPKGTQDVSLLGNRYLMTYSCTQAGGWAVVELMPYASLVSAAAQEVSGIVVLAVLSLLAAAVLAAVLSCSAYQPISGLARLMDSVEDRDALERQAVLPRDRELRRLADSYNGMMARIQSLLQEVGREKEEKLSAQMAALRAQVNPHFLYNTLNVIKCLASSGSGAQAEEICVCLIRLLRMGIGNNRETVPLRDELSYVKNYVEILEYRVDKLFELEDQISRELYDVPVPKFVLQPIVENSIVHGFENNTENNTVLLTAAVEGERLVITVKDNGRGMDASKVRMLEEALRRREGLNFSHVGILNVNERIRHLYGNGYGLKLESFEGDGTTVTVTVPFSPGGEERKAAGE